MTICKGPRWAKRMPKPRKRWMALLPKAKAVDAIRVREEGSDMRAAAKALAGRLGRRGSTGALTLSPHKSDSSPQE